MIPSQNFEALALKTMASGHLCLNLTERVGWDDFPIFAARFFSLIGGHVTRKTDGPDLRIWEIIVDSHPLRFVFDDFPVMVSLESFDDKGDAILKRLHKDLSIV